MVKAATGDVPEMAEPTPSVAIRAKAAMAEIMSLRTVVSPWLERPGGPFDVASLLMLLCGASRLDTCDPRHRRKGAITGKAIPAFSV
jgi:hypothetical protein